MSAINDGGPAFPTQNGCRNDPGMSKREVIAKDALNGYLAGRNNSERTFFPGDTHHADVAKACLRYADALLAEFAKEPKVETPLQLPPGLPLLPEPHEGYRWQYRGTEGSPAGVYCSLMLLDEGFGEFWQWVVSDRPQCHSNTHFCELVQYGGMGKPAPQVTSGNTLLEDMEVIRTIAGPPTHAHSLEAIQRIAAKAIANATKESSNPSIQ